MKADHYDSFAESYSAENESSLLNAYYERPAMVALAGDVEGRRILDVGCGAGPLSAALSTKGAIMTGLDSSPAMLELARQRLGAAAELYLADLGKPLPFAGGSFDDVVSSLVLHYLEDWSAPLAELRRVLKPGGRLFAEESYAPFITHPVWRRLLHHPQEDRFDHGGLLAELSTQHFHVRDQRRMGGGLGWLVADKAL